MSIEGKIIVITGAATGIGRALAAGFDRDGARVVGLDINRQELENTAQMCGGRMITVVGDVCTEADVTRLVSTTLDKYRRIDVLCNNAGISDGGFLLEIEAEKWERVIRINLIGAAFCLRHILPLMLKQGYGRVINVASRGAESVASRSSAYAASKAGLISLTKNIANNIDRRQYPDVLINAIIPGLTITPIWGQAFEKGMIPEERLKEFQPPEAVYPHARFLVELPAGGPSGRTFFHSEDYPIFAHFNE